ncbi:MAG: MnhB domain-containing protein [Egibacteraceae bacterium]
MNVPREQRDERDGVMPSLILGAGTRAVFHTILVFSVFLLFAGHNAPGGGFIGGLVAGAALVLRYVAEGSNGLRRTIPIAPETLLGAGVLVAGGAGAAALATGRDFLTQGYLLSEELPGLGAVRIHSALVFDTGVFLIVVGLVLALLRTLGEELRP